MKKQSKNQDQASPKVANKYLEMEKELQHLREEAEKLKGIIKHQGKETLDQSDEIKNLKTRLAVYEDMPDHRLTIVDGDSCYIKFDHYFEAHSIGLALHELLFFCDSREHNIVDEVRNVTWLAGMFTPEVDGLMRTFFEEWNTVERMASDRQDQS